MKEGEGRRRPPTSIDQYSDFLPGVPKKVWSEREGKGVKGGLGVWVSSSDMEYRVTQRNINGNLRTFGLPPNLVIIEQI